MNPLFGITVSSAALHRIAAHFNGRVVVADRDPLPEAGGAVVVVMDSGMTGDSFARLMEKPFCACLEDGEDVADGPRQREGFISGLQQRPLSRFLPRIMSARPWKPVAACRRNGGVQWKRPYRRR